MTPDPRDAEEVHEHVRERYAERANLEEAGGAVSSGAACCGTGGESCCTAQSASLSLGYSPADLAAIPKGADLGLGCGTPGSVAQVRPGEVVVDLGSGAGIDCFLAGRQVGPTGRVIGVDMTPEMIAKARRLAQASEERSVDFRLGEIEHLPVADASVDVVMSNCVINLVIDKGQVYREAFRVLRPGGRLAIADLVATAPFPDAAQADTERWCSCCTGAIPADELSALLTAAGFIEVAIEIRSSGEPPACLREPGEIGVLAASVRATKPGARS